VFADKSVINTDVSAFDYKQQQHINQNDRLQSTFFTDRTSNEKDDFSFRNR